MNRRTVPVPDDHGRTRHNWRDIDGYQLTDNEWSGFHEIEGATGNPPGPARLPDSEVTPAALRMRRFREHGPRLMTPFEGRTSTPKDWARERIEREQALERVAAQKARRNG